ncbi:MAG: alpha/beta hydrolase [Desulfuromonas sp.]|nr:MAG: alpha/beta hydrolase [Desulfuromonas sp.]
MQLTINDHTISYDDFGEGPALLLIHGFPLSRQMWRPQVEPLVDAGYRVIVPDLRGFGESEGGGVVQMGDFADDLIHLLDYLGVNHAIVGGMSMGGYVMLNLLERYPQRFLGAMFLVTRAASDDAAGKQKRSDMIDAVQSGRVEIVADTFSGLLFAEATMDEQPRLIKEVQKIMETASPQGIVGGLLAMRERRDYVESLEQFGMPTLVIGADQDKAMPLEHYDALMGGLPQVEGTVIVGAGHMVNMEKPALFNSAILRFLEKY